MSVFNLRVYSKKWQSPLKVTAVSVCGLFKELFASFTMRIYPLRWPVE